MSIPNSCGLKPRSSRPTPNMVSAMMLPMKATPNADIGIPSAEPPMPTTVPAPRSAARRPPASPALMASAAARPGGQAALPGKTFESYSQYSIRKSMTIAALAPMSMGHTSCDWPMNTGMPIGRSSELAAVNVAVEMFDCTRFCRCTERIRRRPTTGIRLIASATSTPMMAVLGVTPSVVMIWMPMIAPRTEHTSITARVSGSNAFGWRSASTVLDADVALGLDIGAPR
jgi:hypothetical protein